MPRFSQKSKPPLLAELGQSVLQRLGYKVTTASDRAKALKIFSGDPSEFDLKEGARCMVCQGEKLNQRVKNI
jgi:hypothetical protein